MTALDISMFEKNARVKCITAAWVPSYFGELGRIVACAGRRYKVLFDKDKVEGRMDAGQNLAKATWCLDLEIEAASDADEFVNDLDKAGFSQKVATDILNKGK